MQSPGILAMLKVETLQQSRLNSISNSLASFKILWLSDLV